MENTLRVIVNADRAARNDVEKAKERRENLTAELAAAKQEIHETHRQNAEKAIAKTRANTEEKVKRTAAQLEAETQKKAERLQTLYAENHEMWVQNIVSAVTDF